MVKVATFRMSRRIWSAAGSRRLGCRSIERAEPDSSDAPMPVGNMLVAIERA